ncbi:MAG: hypothetical protein ABF586_13675, partial [Sporolactobacillus sp.]
YFTKHKNNKPNAKEQNQKTIKTDFDAKTMKALPLFHPYGSSTDPARFSNAFSAFKRPSCNK